MEKTANKLQQLVTLIDRHSVEGSGLTAVTDFVLFRDSSGQQRKGQLFQPYILFMAQGEKRLVIERGESQFIVERQEGFYRRTEGPDLGQRARK